jgi:hypothetical protein
LQNTPKEVVLVLEGCFDEDNKHVWKSRKREIGFFLQPFLKSLSNQGNKHVQSDKLLLLCVLKKKFNCCYYAKLKICSINHLNYANYDWTMFRTMNYDWLII